ncbi:hypothetical protein [uncultured Hyphomonas sp.]|jgi:hypothetical protein|uniref:hypothetical protein n=1 Tax=uncultured Hyphomonas sp. TaxID=225298 RepID=UPI0030DB4D9F
MTRRHLQGTPNERDTLRPHNLCSSLRHNMEEKETRVFFYEIRKLAFADRAPRCKNKRQVCGTDDVEQFIQKLRVMGVSERWGFPLHFNPGGQEAHPYSRLSCHAIMKKKSLH